MALFDIMGDEMTDADVNEMVGEAQAGPSTYVIDRDVYEERIYPGTTMGFRYLLFRRGQTITQEQYDRALVSAKDDEPVDPPA